MLQWLLLIVVGTLIEKRLKSLPRPVLGAHPRAVRPATRVQGPVRTRSRDRRTASLPSRSRVRCRKRRRHCLNLLSRLGRSRPLTYCHTIGRLNRGITPCLSPHGQGSPALHRAEKAVRMIRLACLTMTVQPCTARRNTGAWHQGLAAHNKPRTFPRPACCDQLDMDAAAVTPACALVVLVEDTHL